MVNRVSPGDFGPEGWFIWSAEAETTHFAAVGRAYVRSLRETGCQDVILAWDHTRDWKHVVTLVAGAIAEEGAKAWAPDDACPLAALALACHRRDAAGIYLSSSAAVPDMVGMRFLYPGGRPAGEQEIRALTEHLQGPFRTPQPVTPRAEGVVSSYTHWLASLVRSELGSRLPLRLLIDACGGLADRIPERLLAEVLGRVQTIYGTPLRHFFHRVPLPLPAEALELGGQVERGKWDGGFLFSAHGTGLGIVNCEGRWYPLVAAVQRLCREARLRLSCLDPLDRAWVQYADPDLVAQNHRATEAEVILGERGRVKWLPLLPWWDAVASAILLIGRGGRVLFDPDPESPWEAVRIVSFAPANAPPAVAVLDKLKSGPWDNRCVGVRVENFLGEPRKIVLSWRADPCWASLDWLEGKGAILIRVLGREREIAPQRLRTLADLLRPWSPP